MYHKLRLSVLCSFMLTLEWLLQVLILPLKLLYDRFSNCSIPPLFSLILFSSTAVGRDCDLDFILFREVSIEAPEHPRAYETVQMTLAILLPSGHVLPLHYVH